MLTYEFLIDKGMFSVRASSILQHKLRPALKCYTIKNFSLKENNYTFTKTRKINGYIFEEPKIETGSFEILEDNGNKLKIKIIIE